jgi:membrane-bound serine protease (ClpP class)
MLLFLLVAAGAGSGARAQSSDQPQNDRPMVVELEVRDTLQPVRARDFARAIEAANQSGAAAILLKLSTPGGLADSADAMVKAMRASRVPVIVWGANADTRVSGEGLRLMGAADVALMAPGAYLTPLWAEPPRKASLETRTAGSQRLLQRLSAETAKHGRSTAIVPELASGIHWFNGPEALAAGFVDGLAVKPPEALRVAQAALAKRGRPMVLSGARLETAKTSPQELILLALMKPDLCVLLLSLGWLLIYLEVNTPGTIVPGAAGVLLVLLSMFALYTLPYNLSGAVVCVGGLLLLLLEAALPMRGASAIVGIGLLAWGFRNLVTGPIPQLEVSWGTAIGAGLGFGGITAVLVTLGAEARRAKVKTGSEAMLGWLAIAHTPLSPDGQILVRGELWKARLTSLDSSVEAGGRVKVLRADGLVLEVTAIPLTGTL